MENSNKDVYFESIINLVLKHSSFEKEELALDTSLNLHSSGMSSYDALMFLNELVDKFDVKFPENFDVSIYFYTEGLELPNFLKKIIGLSPTKKMIFKKITVEHIINVIEKKEWFDPS
jgi:acyl carrier protein